MKIGWDGGLPPCMYTSDASLGRIHLKPLKEPLLVFFSLTRVPHVCLLGRTKYLANGGTTQRQLQHLDSDPSFRRPCLKLATCTPTMQIEAKDQRIWKPCNVEDKCYENQRRSLRQGRSVVAGWYGGKWLNCAPARRWAFAYSSPHTAVHITVTVLPSCGFPPRREGCEIQPAAQWNWKYPLVIACVVEAIRKRRCGGASDPG